MDKSLVNPCLKSLTWLIGSWVGKGGIGKYPTIKTFSYCEKLEVTHPASHQPVLHVKFSAWFENKETKEIKYAHFENGFLKVRPSSDPLHVTYTSAHNNGLTIIEEGQFEEVNNLLTIESNSVGRTSINKPPAVIRTKRQLKLLDENHLSLRMFMATSTHADLDEHLYIEYEREN